MKNLLPILGMLLLFSCNETKDNVTSNETIEPKIEQKKDIEEPTKDINFLLQYDTLLYSKVFLNALDKSDFKNKVQLKGNQFIFEKDVIYFDETLKLNKEYIFSARMANLDYKLSVKRINLTSVEFSVIVNKNGKVALSKSGIAHLGAGFFLASEMDEDSETGEGYGATEYYLAPENNYTLNIRIGEPDENNKLRATFTYYNDADVANTKLLGIVPTLRTK